MAKKHLITAVGTIAAASLSFGAFAATDDNPFQIEALDDSYVLAQASFGKGEGEGNCGEGNCGDDDEDKDKDKDKDEEGSCGEGTCGEA